MEFLHNRILSERTGNEFYRTQKQHTILKLNIGNMQQSFEYSISVKWNKMGNLYTARNTIDCYYQNFMSYRSSLGMSSTFLRERSTSGTRDTN